MTEITDTSEKIEAITNPMSPGIRHLLKQIKSLQFSATGFLPAILTLPLLTFVLILLLALWPYGLIAIVEDFIRQLMSSTREQLDTVTLVEKTPFALALGIYFLVWIPFGLVCLPIVLIGTIGQLFSKGTPISTLFQEVQLEIDECERTNDRQRCRKAKALLDQIREATKYSTPLRKQKIEAEIHNQSHRLQNIMRRLAE